MINQRALLQVCLIIAAAVISTFLLVKTAGNPAKVKGGFNRKMPIPTLEQYKTFQIAGSEIINLGGSTKYRKYFFTSQMSKILETDHNLENPKADYINIDPNLRSNLKDTAAFITFIDSPRITLFLQNSEAIVFSEFGKSKSLIYKIFTKFTNAVKLNGSSVLIRRSDSAGRNLIFCKVNLQSRQFLNETNITDRLNDGGFATDGKLSYEADAALAVYTHYYCNKIIIFDTNLVIKTLFRTIDTFSNYQASAIWLGDSNHPGGYTFDRPPTDVNNWSMVVNNKIYINSEILSENENPQKFEENSVIDIYDLISGHYLSSFYVPRSNGRKFRRFEIIHDQLIAIYSNGTAVSYFLYHS